MSLNQQPPTQEVAAGARARYSLNPKPKLEMFERLRFEELKASIAFDWLSHKQGSSQNVKLLTASLTLS